MGAVVIYAGPDGLVAAAGTDVQVITEGFNHARSMAVYLLPKHY
jgi:hypothetical protein